VVAALALSTLWAVAPVAAAEPAGGGSDTYQNPLPVRTQDGARVESCADPSVIRGARPQDRPANTPINHRFWYMYCTQDPLNDEDRGKSGFNFNPVPMFRSTDLVHWRYMGNAFEPSNWPAWAAPSSGLWAPEIDYIDGKYRLYYTVTEARPEAGGGSGIGVATSNSPLGPWTHKDSPVVEPHGADCCGPESRRWVFDPEVIRAGGQYYIYYGSYFGGVSVRPLSADGMSTTPGSQTNVAVSNKYEGAEVVKRDGWFYLMLSATDCCRGPLAGYSVFVGRSQSPLGPFLDKDGVDLNDNEANEDATNAYVGGTPMLTMNGNRWVGPATTPSSTTWTARPGRSITPSTARIPTSRAASTCSTATAASRVRRTSRAVTQQAPRAARPDLLDRGRLAAGACRSLGLGRAHARSRRPAGRGRATTCRSRRGAPTVAR
jgi:arabinan endo-1,5-alpha-L-arabinosidase